MHNRRNFIKASSLGVAGMGLQPAINKVAMEKPATDAQVVHHVFFWLKNPGNPTDRNALIAGLKKLKGIETIKAIHIGTVASTEKRDVVDSSWDVSELMFFDDLKGQAVYQEHPLHKQFIAECSHLWKKVVVYDAVGV